MSGSDTRVSWILDADIPGSWNVLHNAPWFMSWIEEVGLSAYHFDAQAFLLAAHDMDGVEFAALDTLQHGLAGDAERAHRLAHRQEVLAGLTVEARLRSSVSRIRQGAPGVSCSPAMMPSLSKR